MKPEFWESPEGDIWKIPQIGTPLCFSRAADRAIRAYVVALYGFRCISCGIEAVELPDCYDGRYALSVGIHPSTGVVANLQIDHIFPRSRGGGNHPNNLQTLCSSCNARKGDAA